jgi:hypothetical protein
MNSMLPLSLGSWPRRAYAALAVLILVLVFGARFIYVETRDSYRAVGLNNGRIEQREETMATIRRSVRVAQCKQLQDSNPSIELLAVKAESLYLKVASDGTVRFCQ